MLKLKINKRNIFYLFIAVIFLIFLIKSIQLLDPDFGWHLRMGEVISKNGIPKSDPFSYTMPSYPFVDHEWLTNFSIAKLYPVLGNLGLSLIFCIIFFSALYLTVSKSFLENFRKKESLLLNTKILLTLLSFAVFIPYFGVRPQILSWFFLAVLIRLVFERSIWLKWRNFVPLILVLWTNLHGSFSIGIIFLFIYFFFRFIRTRKLDKKDILIVFLSFLATFVNPYKERVWWEIWMQATDASLHWRILEWRPMFYTFHTSFLVLLTLGGVFMFKYRNKFYLEEKMLFLFFTFQAVTTLRHVPLWTIIGLNFLFRSMDYFYKEIKSVSLGLDRFRSVNRFFLIGILIIMTADFGFSLYDASHITENKFYPKKAVEYLKNSNIEGEMFSYYGWGGYLIWKLPKKKVFIDGRMPSWRWNKNLPNESNYAMEDYLAISEGNVNLDAMFDKYNIKVILWPREREKTILDIFNENIKNRVYKMFNKEVDKFDFIAEIGKNGWIKIFEDSTAVIFEKL